MSDFKSQEKMMKRIERDLKSLISAPKHPKAIKVSIWNNKYHRTLL